MVVAITNIPGTIFRVVYVSERREFYKNVLP